VGGSKGQGSKVCSVGEKEQQECVGLCGVRRMLLDVFAAWVGERPEEVLPLPPSFRHHCLPCPTPLSFFCM